MIREILQIGDARLRRTAEALCEFDTPELHALVQDMFDTMRASNGVGLAAPQIGINLRVMVFGFESSNRYPEQAAVPHTVLINPELILLDDAIEAGWEGCLSVPGKRGSVPRYKHLRYLGKDQYGSGIDRTVAGFHARIVQHECDHLDGILYPERLTDLASFGPIDSVTLLE